MAKEIINIDDPRFARIVAHPLRLRIIAAIGDDTRSPKELSDELEAPLSNTSYHVRQLERNGMLELVEQVARRGAVEHRYRIRASLGVKRGELVKVT